MARTKNGLPGIYNSSPITLSNEDGSALGVDANGLLMMSPTAGSGANIADGGTFTQNTTIGQLAYGVYLSSPQTLTTGKAGAIAVDVNRNVLNNMATALSYAIDSITAYTYGHSYVTTASDLLIKSGSGVLHTLTLSCNDAAPTAGSLILYDNTAESGTQIFNHTFTTTPFAPLTLVFDIAFSTGLYAGFTTTNDVNSSFSYR